MPDYPPEALRAASEAIERELMSGIDFDAHVESEDALAKAALDAAAPILAQAVAQKILAHMESFGPKIQPGANADIYNRPRRTWRRHFGIAARVASRAFSTREEELRQVAEAMARGEYAHCDIPEDGVPRDA